MRLFNKTIDRQLFKQYSLGSDLSKQEVVAKIFNPMGAGTWFILNSDPQDPDYLWAIVDLGYGAEVGSVSRSELENYRGRFGLGFERDLSFDPINAEELYQGLRRGEYYANGGGVDDYSDLYGQEVMALKNAKTQAKKTKYDYVVYQNEEGEISFARKNDFDTFFDKDKLDILYSVNSDGLAKNITAKTNPNGNTFDNVFLNYGFTKKRGAYGIRPYENKKFGAYAQIDDKTRSVEIETPDDQYKGGYSVKSVIEFLKSKGFEENGFYADGGQIEVVYERRADFKKKPIKLLLLSRGKEQKGYTFSGKDQVAVLENYNRNKQEDLEKLWNLKGYETKYADGGDIADFSDNQLMIMNQNVEVEHHHEELEDILEDKVPVPAWVVAKMETATQNLSDITHYLDGQKEIAEDQLEEEDDDDDEEEMEAEEIENKEVVEPIVVTAGDKTEITKNFTDDAWDNLRGFLKGYEGIDLRDDYTFDYKDEQFEVEPIINSDENGVSNAVFTIFDGDGEEVGEVTYSRDGGKQKFTANSEFFSWNNAKFEDGGYFDGTIPNVSSYMSNYADGGQIEYEIEYKDSDGDEYSESFKTLEEANAEISRLQKAGFKITDKMKHKVVDGYGTFMGRFEKGGKVDLEKVNKADEIYREHNRERKQKGIENFSKESVALWNEKYDDRLQKLKLTFEEKNALNPKKWYAHGGETEEGVDLFEDYENIPEDLQEILDNYQDAFEDGDYKGLEKALKEANAIGYTFEYYLDGQAYDLRKIGQKGKSEVEEYAKGGNIKKYILKADIKSVTVKRKGKEVTYKGADVLNGAHVLAKGGDITSKANYVGKNDVVEVELKDGSKVKPVNGYWIKKGAEPISNEPTPTASGKYNAVAFDGKKQIANLSDNEYSDKIESFIKDNEKKGFEVIVDLMNKGKVEQQVYKTSFNKSNETKFGETYIKKDMRNNWKAETTLDDFNDYDWKISTIKTYSGNLVSSAQGGKTEPTGSKGIQMWKYTMYQDPNYTLEVSKPSRLTEKLVSEQHEKALAKFKKFMETGTFKGGGKISKFDKLSAKVAKQYEGKPVKSQYQEEYGKYYSKEEAQEVGDKVAGKMKAMTADKKENGGRISMKLANELAKEIRKDGESWNDAKKRAFAQLKK